MLSALVVIAIECAVMAGIIYTLKYTVTHRSGLNEPEKLRRIWSRSQEIRFQPVFKSMIFSILVAHGAPAIFVVLLSFGIAFLGTPAGIFSQVQSVLGLLVMFMCACVGPIIYRASGGQRRVLNVVALLSFGIIMMYLLIFETVQDLAKSPRFKDNTWIVWFSYFITPIFLAGLQIPFAMWGAARQFDDTASRIYSSNPVPDWVRLNKSVLLASGPLIIVRLITLAVHYKLGNKTYLNRIGYLLADGMMFSVAGLASVISVNRALLAEDFRWQWRSFLTPAIPLGIFDFVVGLVSTFAKSNGHFITRVFLVIQHVCIYGSIGSLSAYLYLFLAEKYAQDQLTEHGIGSIDDDLDNQELDNDIGEDLFDNRV